MQVAVDDKARVEGGLGLVYKRGGTFYARVRIAANKYVYRSLKTGNKAVAIKAAQKLVHKIEFQTENELPVQIKKFADVIKEYVAFREKQHEQGRTSIYMLRQIQRVSKFWIEYAGKRSLMAIDNGVIKEYEEWRRDYYRRKTAEELAAIRNYKINPTDKTLQWEYMLGKAIIKWAHDKGYRGKAELPTYVFKVKKKRVRPAFEVTEYQQLWRALLKWERDCTVPEYLHTRQLLRDYVLILANSGMRVGEANNLRIKDVQPFKDEFGRKNYRFIVRGKTGERDVIPRVICVKYVDRLLARREKPKADEWLFAMKTGTKVITLIDQFDKVIDEAGMRTNSHGEKFSLYSLRHFYAVMARRANVGVYDIARNMGTSVQVIESYYGKHGTNLSMATLLGGPLVVKKNAKKEKDRSEETPVP
jgi:integrase